MGILGWILFGLIAGVIAKLIMPGKDPGGFIVTILLGIAGAFMGGFIGQALGLYAEGETAARPSKLPLLIGTTVASGAFVFLTFLHDERFSAPEAAGRRRCSSTVTLTVPACCRTSS